jgi:hypothetical protein
MEVHGHEGHRAVTLVSRAAVKKVIPNWSVTNVTRRVVSRSSISRPASIESERVHSYVMSVSKAAAWGRSESRRGRRAASPTR